MPKEIEMLNALGVTLLAHALNTNAETFTHVMEKVVDNGEDVGDWEIKVTRTRKPEVKEVKKEEVKVENKPTKSIYEWGN